METFVGDTIEINVETGIDLSSYATLQIKFRRPNMSMGIWAATIDPADDTRMYYETDETDLNMEGTWYLQANAKNGAPAVDLHGQWVPIKVQTPFADTTSSPTTLAPTTVWTTLAPTTV